MGILVLANGDSFLYGFQYKLHKFIRFYTSPSSFESCSMTYIGITKEQNE